MLTDIVQTPRYPDIEASRQSDMKTSAQHDTRIMKMNKWHGGKGSKQRPRQVPKNQFDDNWDRIFGKNNNERKEKSSTGG